MFKYGKYELRKDKFGHLEIHNPETDRYDFLDRDSLILEFLISILKDLAEE
jgi:hypothetical protein